MSDPRAAHDAIDRLLASYPLLLDSGDVTACVDLFVQDCEFVIDKDRVIAGRAALQQFFERVVDGGAGGIHLAAPGLVHVAPDGSTATMWQSFLFVANGSNVVTRGMYRDTAVVDGDRWRFRRRDIELFPGAPTA